MARIPFFVQSLCILAVCHGSAHQPGNVYFPDKRQENFINTLQKYEVVDPVEVDAGGQVLSFSPHHRSANTRPKRDLRAKEPFAYYRIKLKEETLLLNLTVNQRFLSDNYILEKRRGNHSGAKIKSHDKASCHFLGTVLQRGAAQGPAAISTCNGLVGYFKLSDGDYFIEPIRRYPTAMGAQQPHIIYKRHSHEDSRRRRRETHNKKKPFCGVEDNANDIGQHGHSDTWNQKHGRQVSQRSVSKERWVETLVVADTKMIEYHGSENIESYIFTILNMVTGIFHDPSIGNAIHIMLVRLILLEEEEQGLKIIHHADHTLASFCKWQKSINPKSDTHPTHHDVAVLLTRKDICAGTNHPCETLGLSHLAGLCQPSRSCNINEDSGLPLAFTIAHELGHSFGIQHDGQGNDCEVIGRHPYIMSRQLHYNTSPLTWSHCSKEYITRFLDRGLGFCLDDAPAKTDMKPPIIAPGVLYDVQHQCQLQYGPNATFCEDVDNVCQTLWCSVDGFCRSKLDAAADGTRCGEKKWCFTGECVTVGKHPETVNGGWGMWSPWTHCTRTCGAGVQSAERKCNDPEPKFGGKYCTGERKRYRMCKVLPCPKDRPTFRQMQCSEFDTVPYKNGLHQWTPIHSKENPCELHCRPNDGHFADKMLDEVVDGTPCYERADSRDICISGICKNVGCDYEISSNATEDRCGVCLGDGSSCQTVQKTFNQSEGFGYIDVGHIPKGARDIRIIELAEAGNFLALRGEDPEKYFLNGGFIIQWNGDYKIAGTTFQYDRTGDLENLTASGPTNQTLWIQLLFQETNPGVRYEYTIQKAGYKENDTEADFKWQYGRWTDCSATCGSGMKKQTAYCVKKGRGVVRKTFCDAQIQPNTRHKKCNEQDCPPRWWTGEWQKCSTTCGPTGEKKRTVLCVQTLGSDEQAMHAEDCHHLLKPKTHASCNRDVLCPSDWTVSNWTECSVSCGGGIRMRTITCSKNNDEPCDISKRPNTKALCGLQQCPLRRKFYLPNKIATGGNSPSRTINRKAVPVPKPGPSGKTRSPKYKPRTTLTSKAPMTSLATSPSYSVTDPNHFTSTIEDIKQNENILRNSSNLNINESAAVTDIKGLKTYSERTVTNQPTATEMNTERIPGVIHVSTEGGDHDLKFTASQGTRDVSPGYDFLTEDPDFDIDDTDGSTQNNDEEEDIQQEATNVSKSKSGRNTPLRKTHVVKMPNTTDRLPTYTPNEFPTESSFQDVSSSGSIDATTQESLANIEIQINMAIIESVVTGATPGAQPSLDENAIQLPKNSSTPFVESTDYEFNGSTNGSRQNNHHLDWNLTGKEDGNIMESAFWIVGNWSECSTTCGVGAVWRDVHCSTMDSSDCQHVAKPDPARRCHLRPCATWKIGSWSKCSVNCGGGMKTREVLCIDAYEKRSLRPFHCQLLGPKPAHNKRCKPEACFQWVTEPWNECSSTCGGGTQHRAITCNNIHYNRSEDQSLCGKESRPEESRKCNLHPCKNSTAPPCKMDRMSVNFCQTLKSIGKCALLNIQAQCCFTCSQRETQQHLKRRTLRST
ncbi:A disintegrin and metalloproteinase with thrombospondin motifs 12 [Ambystoma mexicanum]|uniref:A disintegrin and metalloproteinase with thrombospondin motifs 12 n=1 Tax=Ambystoma mexicanum TaxID=8296 RepID=UPI0037E8ADE8